MDAFIYAAAFLFGLIFGSFGNVVIWRLPRGESLSVPASHCPQCNTPIEWRDNVPVISWLLLLGRCRACGVPISVRYPAVELLSGLLWLAAAVRFGFTPTTLATIVFFYILMLLAFIDADTMRLPNPLVGTLGVVGLVAVIASQVTGLPIAPVYRGTAGWLAQPVGAAALGSIGTAGFVLVIAIVYAKLRGREGFGMGDVKLLAVMGLFLGTYTPLVLLLGSLGGSIFGLLGARRSAEGLARRFPFGPFLAAAAVIVTLWGGALVAAYLRLIGLA